MFSYADDKSLQNTQRFVRESTFQLHDMHGTLPVKLLPQNEHKTSYNLSTFVEPKSIGFKKFEKTSDPLKIDDIEGTKPSAVGFNTKRITDPVCPVYKLPSCAPVSIE
jgi:hypothetical protein